MAIIFQLQVYFVPVLRRYLIVFGQIFCDVELKVEKKIPKFAISFLTAAELSISQHTVSISFSIIQDIFQMTILPQLYSPNSMF